MKLEQVIPFGLQGPLAIFVQLINKVLHEHLYNWVLAYLDDILIYSEMMDKPVKLIQQLLKKHLDVKLYAKLSKCKFHKSSLEYLGYRVSCKGVEIEIHLGMASSSDPQAATVFLGVCKLL